MKRFNTAMEVRRLREALEPFGQAHVRYVSSVEKIGTVMADGPGEYVEAKDFERAAKTLWPMMVVGAQPR